MKIKTILEISSEVFVWAKPVDLVLAIPIWSIANINII
jgi:hypothetical protein